jgi:hypothetical protein
MKKQFITLAIILLTFGGFTSTEIVPDQRLIDYLGAEKTETMLKNNPELVRYYNYFLDHSYLITQVPQDKYDATQLPVINVPLLNGKPDPAKMNVLKLEIQRKYDDRIILKIANCQYLLVMLSEKEFIEKYNEHRRSLGLIIE